MSQFRALLLAVIALTIGACQTTGGPTQLPTSEDLPPGYRPPPSSPEAGLWMAMERAERKLTTSGRAIRDPELQTYIGDIICKVSPEYCETVRFAVISNANFNANMAPQGFMQMWTGALLRFDNEAQLAYVLAHEIKHYQRRHSLKRWETTRDSTNALYFFNIATLGIASPIVSLATLGGLMSYSRDQEREADDLAVRAMAEVGYDPREAKDIWTNLIAERDANEERDDPNIFLATHPDAEERKETLAELALELNADGVERERGTVRYRSVMRRFLPVLIDQELSRNELEESEVLFKRKLDDALDEDVAVLQFALAEVYQRRGQEGDGERAIELYEQSLQSETPPAATYRALGLAYWRSGDKAAARPYLENYLIAQPDATDRAMVEHMLASE